MNLSKVLSRMLLFLLGLISTSMMLNAGEDDLVTTESSKMVAHLGKASTQEGGLNVEPSGSILGCIFLFFWGIFYSVFSFQYPIIFPMIFPCYYPILRPLIFPKLFDYIVSSARGLQEFFQEGFAYLTVMLAADGAARLG